MKPWKKIALQEALNEVAAIEDAGHIVDRCTDYHWKIDGIDVWPSARKYMKNGRVKFYQELKEVLN